MGRFDLFARVQARVARYLQEIVPGTEIGQAIDIERLICPLRYDLWVRIEFVRLLRDQWALYTGDLDAFLNRPESRAYQVWFRDIRCALYRPEIHRDAELLRSEFIKRVHETATLWRSIDRNGYDRSTPIRLGSGKSIRTVNGKAINSTYFAGDGCHRMSCLYVTGQTWLQPADYEVQVRQALEPLDITAMLIQQHQLDRTVYLRFLSRFYGDGSQVDSADQIVQHVTAKKPELLPELESVLAFDLPILRP
ncbi:MAG TPA: hypothetical protein VNO19_05770 [Gemmatimonadales bacterium]|nr:hypothetical protein [Gemmatimonadales bacterium]